MHEAGIIKSALDIVADAAVANVRAAHEAAATVRMLIRVSRFVMATIVA